MAWIEGSVWEGGKCYAQVVSTSGERSRERFLSAIENLAALGVPSRRRVLLDLTSASVSDTDSYLAHFGLDERQNRHDVLTFFADGKRILFPAILLAHAIFTPFHKLVPYMVVNADLNLTHFGKNRRSKTDPPGSRQPAALTAARPFVCPARRLSLSR